ncbi:MAG: hypothetical protein MI723_11380 [Caulobacterales bacterium]|nr:hypothetical protein [Caulobacterales bacterium]
MDVPELLEKIRDLYVNRLLVAIDEAASEHGSENVFPEPVLVDRDGEPGGRERAPLRLDLVVRHPDGQHLHVRVDSEERVAFQPIEFEWDPALTVRLEPFVWDDAHITAAPYDQGVRACFEGWFRDALDPDRENQDVPAGVAHFMEGEDIGQYALDLGTLHPAALEDLWTRLSDAGVTSVTIASAPDLG